MSWKLDEIWSSAILNALDATGFSPSAVFDSECLSTKKRLFLFKKEVCKSTSSFSLINKRLFYDVRHWGKNLLPKKLGFNTFSYLKTCELKCRSKNAQKNFLKGHAIKCMDIFETAKNWTWSCWKLRRLHL